MTTTQTGKRLGLTPRQSAVLFRLHRGDQPKVIADDLQMAMPTCRAHMRLIYERLGVHDKAQACLVWERELIKVD